ncbi:hypothetical protein N7475_008704 [Penicillium sp. IBT 31633x]|nr:hypothetical protein N7475_008704 [Penicillium sp. IBT 31633x]
MYLMTAGLNQSNETTSVFYATNNLTTMHQDRLREELRERRLARTKWQNLSETSNVLFSITRAQDDGFPTRRISCLMGKKSTPIYVYMSAKYTSRWSFFRVAAFMCNAQHWNMVNEVLNPSKSHKIDEVAFRRHINQEDFQRVSRQLRRVWPLFP